MGIEIAGRRIGEGQPLFVIAELGLNHGGSLDKALAMVDAASRAGASAIKLQTIEADALVAGHCPPPAHVAASSLRDFFRQFELDEDAHRAVMARARVHGLAVLSTAFSEAAVDMLDRIGCDALKIASGDITHRHLIERAAATGRPLILSTGMSDLHEVGRALAWASAAGAGSLALLHCVSAYPVPPGAENLAAIGTLGRAFGLPVGLSDHTTRPWAAALAVALGASLYERHFVLEGDDAGVDAAVSADARQLAEIIGLAEDARLALGHGRRECSTVEAVNVRASRRSLYARRSLARGERVTDDAVIALRPADGLDASRWSELVGIRLPRDVDAGAPFLDSDLEVPHGDRTPSHVA
jgi:sialic acid synthase SpsE